jgi:hypothetical protein
LFDGGKFSGREPETLKRMTRRLSTASLVKVELK